MVEPMDLSHTPAPVLSDNSVEANLCAEAARLAKVAHDAGLNITADSFYAASALVGKNRAHCPGCGSLLSRKNDSLFDEVAAWKDASGFNTPDELRKDLERSRLERGRLRIMLTEAESRITAARAVLEKKQ